MKHAMIIITLLATTLSISAQRSASTRSINTNSKMAYHNGPIMGGTSDVYIIWYGCWNQSCGNTDAPITTDVVERFMENIGGSPYMQMNSLYPGGSGWAPTGGLMLGGWSFDQSYSHGLDLTQAQIADLVREQIETNRLPQDPSGIYIVLASADIASNSTGFCAVDGNTPPLHGVVQAFGSDAKYGFIGNPLRCPTLEAPQFMAANGTRLPTPNNDFAADSMITAIAHVLNTIISNPNGSAWYDRYGLENADKCMGTYGTTWTTSNGARANQHLGGRDYLIGQNWINDKRQRCGMQLYQF